MRDDQSFETLGSTNKIFKEHQRVKKMNLPKTKKINRTAQELRDFKVTRREIFKRNEKVILVPISSHGKNRVHHQGDTWIIMNESTQLNTVKHRNCSGPFILCEKDGVFRWISTTDDPDFKVEKIGD